MTVSLSDGIRLFSGAMFDYNNPAACDVAIEDIAHAASQICRFAGHTKHFYSVAQHAVNASMIVAPGFEFDALMHDTAESFTNDIPTPLKVAVPMFKELELRIEAAMAAKFNFAFPLPAEVKLVDTQMLGFEKAALLPQDTSQWEMLQGVPLPDHLRQRIDLRSWAPEQAKRNFLARYEELSR
jgi:hypothetical protein